ncbi:NAD(P)H-hydrate dehydratase [Intrasporangium oryzae]|uniref:NAD(P)H-hydrate dehydratase n=1 Tax=Intrasporangium oryzae TaxID=412687 RepID=UPI00248067C8|nr:NAD(P)H-hydrate dehydratase [Intrasporangium oryzae]
MLPGPGLSEDEVERDQHDAVLRLADATGAVVLSGGEVSYAVSSGRGAWRGSGGAAGLATAGSGAVKAGVVAGLLARGASPEQAVVWGSWAHTSAGALLAAESPGFLARDVMRLVPRRLAAVDASTSRRPAGTTRGRAPEGVRH